GRTARLHYCVFNDYHGKALDIGRYVLDKLLHMARYKDEGYIIDLLIGYVPAWNEKAINFSLKCGGKTNGTVPMAIWNDRTQQSEDAVFIFYTREEG
ncbi:MAG: hypothetical protein MI802_09070, partial [Desulfobacterales bacterium]|nr:hypothetical protein [Desulfobacterales bacterium]